MSKEKLYKVLLSPIISEKTTIASANNQYVFKVLKSATKKDIKLAVELLFNVSVNKVQTLNMIGKQKVFARKIGRRASWKKAIVRVAEGQMIDTTA